MLPILIQIPKRRRSEETQTGSVDETEGNPDTVVKNSFNESQKVATMFLNGFLQKFVYFLIRLLVWFF